MAKITFSLDELIGILSTNAILPGKIVSAKAKGRSLQFAIKTGSFILPFVPASLSYTSFDGNNAVFELNVVGGRLNKATSWFNELLKPKLPACMILDYPNISVDVNKLLAEKGIKGVRVKDMFFENDKFAIVTGNA
jgi:hypothetical protein